MTPPIAADAGVDPPPGVTETAARVADGTTTAAAEVDAALRRIARHDPVLRSFTTVFDDDARRDAAALDAAMSDAAPGPLHGVPIAIKDDTDVAGVVTSHGGRAFTTPAPADADIVARLRSAGAIPVGKTAVPELCIWPFTETRTFGITRNPWSPTDGPPLSAAGSSGGSAAAVAAGLVPAATGGDGGGSIRLPAAWTGLFGLKMGAGRVSSAPHDELWRGLGQLGVLTRSVADAALLYQVLADPSAARRDPGAADDGAAVALDASGRPLPDLIAAAATDPAPLRIAVSAAVTGPGVPGADPSVRAALTATAALLASLGHDVREVDPGYPRVAPEFMALVAGGVRDGAAGADRPDLFEPRTRRFLRGARLLDGPRRSRWLRARLERITREWNTRFFGDIDVLLMPTTATAAPIADQLDSTSLVATLWKAAPVAGYTSIWNALGNPAASLPAGTDDADRPLAVQLVAAPGREDLIVAVAAQLERAGDRHRVRLPAGYADVR
ncbi:amidase [Gordonia sinesedis]